MKQIIIAIGILVALRVVQQAQATTPAPAAPTTGNPISNGFDALLNAITGEDDDISLGSRLFDFFNGDDEQELLEDLGVIPALPVKGSNVQVPITPIFKGSRAQVPISFPSSLRRANEVDPDEAGELAGLNNPVIDTPIALPGPQLDQVIEAPVGDTPIVGRVSTRRPIAGGVK